MKAETVKKRTETEITYQWYVTQKNECIRRGIKLNYTLEEFRNWVFNTKGKEFNTLYKKWINSGCLAELKPSCGLLNHNDTYTLDNIYISTVGDTHNIQLKHVAKKSSDKVIAVLNNIEYQFDSVNDACKNTSVRKPNIIAYLKGNKSVNCKGYTFYYK